MLAYTTFRDMTTRRNLGDPIYFRIDKSIYFEDFSPNNLLKILEIEADKQLFQIVNHEDINRQQVIRLAARKNPRYRVKRKNGSSRSSFNHRKSFI